MQAPSVNVSTSTSGSGLGARKLDRTPLRHQPALLARCHHRNITCVRDVLARPELDLCEELDLHRFEARDMQELLVSSGGPPFTSAFRMLQQEYGLAQEEEEQHAEMDNGGVENGGGKDAAAAATASSHVQAASSSEAEVRALSSALAGSRAMLALDRGVAALRINKGITELVGPAGIGKTQACLTLCVESFLPTGLGGLGGGTVYIDTERTFQGNRLLEIAQHRYPAHYGNKQTLRELSSNTVAMSPSNPQELLECLKQVEDMVLEKGFKLIILDSIAFLARAVQSAPSHHYSHNSASGASAITARNELLGEVSSRLKSLSEQLGVACVVTNQVSAKFFPKDGSAAAAARAGMSSEMELQAALGVAWAHAVNTRLLLQSDAEGKHRFITVAKSPMYSSARYHYVIQPMGFTAIPAVETGDAAANINGTVVSGSVVDMGMRATHQMTVSTRR